MKASCKFCVTIIGRYNKTGVCRSCQSAGEHYDCAGGCGCKITHSRFMGSGMCKACLLARRRVEARKNPAAVMTPEQRRAVTLERVRANAHWPLGKPRGRAVRCPIGRFGPLLAHEPMTIEERMLTAMRAAGVALGDPAEDRVTSSHRPSLSSPAAQVAGAFGGRSNA